MNLLEFALVVDGIGIALFVLMAVYAIFFFHA